LGGNTGIEGGIASRGAARDASLPGGLGGSPAPWGERDNRRLSCELQGAPTASAPSESRLEVSYRAIGPAVLAGRASSAGFRRQVNVLVRQLPMELARAPRSPV